jgi:hypothetical protein
VTHCSALCKRKKGSISGEEHSLQGVSGGTKPYQARRGPAFSY